MTQEHLTDQEIARYQQRAFEPAERPKIDRHVAACEACLRRIAGPEHVEVAFTSLTEAFLSSEIGERVHLSRAELNKYARGLLDSADTIVFESHLEDCPDCNFSLRQLSVKSTVSSPLTGGRVNGFWNSFPDIVRQASLRPAYVGGVAFAIVLTLVAAFWIQSRFAKRLDQPNRVDSARHEAEPPRPFLSPQTAQSSPQESVGLSEKPSNSAAQPGVPPSSVRSPEASSQVVVSLVDGNQRITLDRNGRLTGLEAVPVTIQGAVKQALSDKMERPQSLAEITAPPIKLLDETPSGVSFQLARPLGLVILTDRPTFAWKPLIGASAYRVSVFDSNFNRVLMSEPQTFTSWSSPTPLPRGRVYFWEVTAEKDGQRITSPVAPVPRAQFKVVEVEKLEEINRAKRESADSHLVLGILYARAGLLAEAEREFQLLANANPRSQVATKLLRRVQAWGKR